jgi:hypothetical protein
MAIRCNTPQTQTEDVKIVATDISCVQQSFGDAHCPRQPKQDKQDKLAA